MRSSALGEGAIAGQLVNFDHFLNSPCFASVQVLVIVFCATVVILDGFDAQLIADVAPAIAAEWGLRPASFGPTFGAGLFGLMFGALVLGPAADRFGRKRLLILSVFIFGMRSSLTPIARSLSELLVIRVLSGFGLDEAMPNIIAFTSEYLPLPSRAAAVTVMFCGVPVGAPLGGLLSAWIIPTFGWPSIFYLGGILPIGLAPVMAIWMPESVRFTIAAGKSQTKIRAIVTGIAPHKINKRTRRCH